MSGIGTPALAGSVSGAVSDVNVTQVAGSAISLGQKPMASSFPVVIASDQGAIPVFASSIPLPLGAATSANQTTIIGHVDGIEALLTTIDTDTGNIATSVASIDTKTPALGQALSASSLPVVLTAAQLSTLTPVAAITGFATSANQTTIIGHVDGIETLLGTISASLSVIDDWDDTDRAKVNTIAGQIGVQGGSGGANALTQRMVLATDVALPTGSNTIGAVTATGNVASAATDSGNPVKMGSVYNSTKITVTNLQRVDSQGTVNGFQRVDLGTALGQTIDSITAYSEGQKATYSVGVIGLAPAASATDIFTITGSATKTIRITRIQVSGTATAAGAYSLVVLRRSTANTGGTSTAPTISSHDTADPNATATVNAYTANPTTGTLVGNMQVKKITVTTPAGSISNSPNEIWFEMRGERATVLRGIAQVLSINLNTTTMAGGSLDIDITWTEE